MDSAISLAFEEIAKVSIFMQIPIVVLIIFFSYQVYKLSNVYNYKYIFIGWIINFIYLLINVVVYYFNIKNHQTLPEILGKDLFESVLNFYQRNSNLIYSLCLILDFSYCYFFFIAGFDIITYKPIVNFFKIKRNKILVNSLFISLMIFFFIYKYIFITNIDGKTNSYDLIPYYFRVSIPLVVFEILSFYTIMIFYKNSQSYLTKNKFIYYGFVIYLCIQVLGFFDNDNHNGIYAFGYLFSLIAKAFILYGLHLLFIEHAKRINILKETLGNTFHDVNRLLSGAEEYVTLLAIHKGNNEYVKKLDLTFSEALATFVAQKTLYEEALNRESEFNLNNIYTEKINAKDEIEQESEKFEIQNVNVLLQISLITLKKYLTKKIRIKPEYSSNCAIFVNKNDFIRTFSNIIKNSIDELSNYEKGIICIKTTNNSIQLEDKIVKEVVIEISDNGSGVKEEHLTNIFKSGFTTKEGSDRGYGLSISKNIIESKYKGRIEVISPYINYSLNNKERGVLFKITLPGI